MAGEWIQIDIGLDEKPEVQEIIETSGATVEQVVYRLFRLWGWATLNTADGILSGTPATLSRMFGGDDNFWATVQAAGWLAFTADRKIIISAWDKRFSKGAKARIMDNRSKAVRRMSGDCPDDVRQMSGSCPENVRVPTGQNPDQRRGEEIRGDENREYEYISCPEAATPPSAPELRKTFKKPRSKKEKIPDLTPVLYSVPVIGDPANPSWNLTRGLSNELSTYYPGCDMEKEIRAAVAWILANPEKRKTAGGMRRFLTSWVNRAVNQPGVGRNGSASPVPTIIDRLANLGGGQ